jgi:hypothetical protein
LIDLLMLPFGQRIVALNVPSLTMGLPVAVTALVPLGNNLASVISFWYISAGMASICAPVSGKIEMITSFLLPLG